MEGQLLTWSTKETQSRSQPFIIHIMTAFMESCGTGAICSIIGPPCTRCNLHFLCIFDMDLQSSRFFKMQSSSLSNVATLYLHSSTCEKLSSSHLHSSMSVGENLHLCLQPRIGIIKCSWEPAGSPIVAKGIIYYAIEL